MSNNNGLEVGSRTVSVHTKREVKVFAINESELNTISYLNAVTTGLITFAVIFLETFVETVNNAIEGYKWFLDKSLWLGLFLLTIAIVGIFMRRGIIGDIKKQSKTID
ncbi:hypothetical protein ACFL0U_03880 [Pseudomonadota bacterium]